MSAIETSNLVALDTKAVSDDGLFSGYASRFGVRDQGGDIVAPGAFTKALAGRPPSAVKLLRQHDQTEPIGVIHEVREDGQGLYVSGRIILDTVKGRETHALMKAGALDGLSIGYRTKKSRFDRVKSARVLEEVELKEVSIVAFPMLPSATVTAVKSSSHTSELAAAINAARAKIKG